MPRDNGLPGWPRLLTVAAIVIVVAALYVARQVLIPLALAILLTFLLAPVVRRLERLGLGRIASVAVVVLLASGVFVGVAWLITDQAVALTARLPEYQQNIRNKIQSLRSSTDGTLATVTRTFEELKAEMGAGPETQRAPAEVSAVDRLIGSQDETLGRRPVPVEVVETGSGAFAVLTEALGLIGPSLATAGICIVFVVFMLIEREDLRDRIISLTGRSRLHLTTEALDDAGQRISRYLLMQLVINVSYGVPVGIGLYFIGLPNAALWGLLAILLRYLPYIGPWIAASLPIALSLAVFDDWWHVFAVVALFLSLELLSNNVMEPWLYGSTTGLSTVAVVVSAVFWGWLWGGVGLLLATPMTACLVVLGKHIPQLGFLNVLLGDEPVLPPQTRFYQRLLAMDQEEAGDLMEEYLEQDGEPQELLTRVYDELLVPALHLAEQDHHRGQLPPERRDFVLRSIRAMVEEVREWETEEKRQAAAGPGEVAAEQPSPPADFPVLCVPVRDEGDELAAFMLAQYLQGRGLRAEHLSATYLTGEVVREVEQSGARLVCLSAVPPGATTYSRYLCKRLRGRLPELPIVAGLWESGGDLRKVSERLRRAGADEVVTTFAAAYDRIRAIVQRETLKAEAAVTPSGGRVDAA